MEPTQNNHIFTKQDTLFYKGIGILLIVIHNYLHWQKGFGLENEDKFKLTNVQKFIEHLYPFAWTDTLSSIFGYLGHYGVQLFIFFSAYGLSMQFINSKINSNYWSYLFKRLKKLYFLLFFGIILFIIFCFTINGNFYGITRTIKESILLATSISNFRHETLYKMFVGPFWFFGLMVQLYIVFPFVFRLVRKYNTYIVFLCSFIIIYALYYIDLKTDFSLFGTIIGHLPEVILGIFLALHKKKKPSTIVFIASIIIFTVSQINIYAFPLSFLSMTLILLFIIENSKLYFNEYWFQAIKYFGEISMTLFVVNGFLRLAPAFKIDDMTLRGERIFLYLILLFISCHYIHKLYVVLVKKLKI